LITDRPTHIAVELRLPIGEVDALAILLGRFARLVERSVLRVEPGHRTEALSAIAKLQSQLEQRNEPFEVQA
jgi:hypothetical protein